MRSIFRYSLAPTALILLVSCSSVRVSTDYNLGTDFSGLRSYDWAVPAAAEERSRAGRLDETIRHEIDRQLAGRGFVLEPGGPADFLVLIDTNVETREDLQSTEDSLPDREGIFTDPPWGGRDEVVRVYEEGALTVAILRPDNETVLWRGIAQTDINAMTSAEKREARVMKAVTRLMNRFPPK